MTRNRSTFGTLIRAFTAAALPVMALAACGNSDGAASAGGAGSGSGGQGGAGGQGAVQAAGLDTARATFAGTDGQQIGSATLIGTPHGVLVQASLEGFPPGTHAFHLHQTGSCSPDFTASGGHYNPHGTGHGFFDPAGRHVGDLPNVHVPESGNLEVELFADLATLREGDAALLDDDGSAIVVHQGADDYRTDPAGAGGDRIACAVIRG